jgi:hypothetical protein
LAALGTFRNCREPPPFTKKFKADHTSLANFGAPTIRPAPRRPAGLPSVTPHDRRRRLRPDADFAGLVGVGAVGGERRTTCSASISTTPQQGSVEMRGIRYGSDPQHEYRSDTACAGMLAACGPWDYICGFAAIKACRIRSPFAG